MANEQSGFEAGDVIYREMDGSAGKSTNYTTSNKIGFHYGVYIGDDTVIDFSGEFGVRKCSLDKFAAGLEVSKEKVKNPRSGREIVKTAIYYHKNPDEWGEYSLAFKNCEHFAKFCATGVKESSQVKTVVDIGIKTGLAVAKAILESP